MNTTVFYVLISVLLNIHTGELDTTTQRRESGPYDAQACVQAALDKGPQHPDGDNVRAYACIPVEVTGQDKTT